MWPLVTYSNYFKIVSTGLFLFKTVILYNDYTRYNICSAWFLDIIISTCFKDGQVVAKQSDQSFLRKIFAEFEKFSNTSWPIS